MTDQGYEAARQEYQQLMDAGVKSPDLYYNLGNAQSRLGNKGEAVLNYCKALQITPRDADTLFNLKRVMPGLDPRFGIPELGQLNRVFNWASFGEWLAVFLLSYWILMGVVARILWCRKTGNTRGRMLIRLAVASLSVALLSLCGTLLRYYERAYVNYSIVLDKEATVRSGPGENFARVDSAQEGSFLIRGTFLQDDWVDVQFPDGRKGFTRKSAIAGI